MRVEIIGDNLAARTLKGYLEKSGYAVVKNLPNITVYLAESNVPNVIVDSIDSELERKIVNSLEDLGHGRITLQREGGVRSDTSIKITYPVDTDESVARAITRGVISSFTDRSLESKEEGISMKSIEKMSGVKPWWKKILPFLSLVILLPNISSAQQFVYGRAWDSVNVAPVDPGDSTNRALRVNVIAGGAGGGLSQLQVRKSDNTWTDVGFFTGNQNVPVNCVTGCSGSSFADSSAFSFTTTPISLSGFVVDDVGTNTVAENSAGLARMNSNRIVYFDISKTVANTNALLTTGTGGTFPVTGTFWPTTAGSPSSTRLTDGASFYDARSIRSLTNTDVVKAQIQANDGTGITQTGGSINVNCTGGCGGASTFSDNSAFTGGSTAVNNMGALYTTSPPAITSGNAGIPRMNSSRVLLTDESASIPTDSSKIAVYGSDTFRVKGWNSWPQAEQISTTSPACSTAGPENFMAKVVIKFKRKTAPDTLVTATKIMTMDNDRGSAGGVSAGLLAVPFGSAASKQRGPYNNATTTMKTASISSCTVANPTVCLTSAAHNMTTGDLVLITASTVTTNPAGGINGLWYITVTDTTHFSLPVNVTVTGTATVNTSRILVDSTNNPFLVTDVGKTITVSAGGVICDSSSAFGTTGLYGNTTSFAGLSPCQGPKFPVEPNVYQGTIIGYTSASTVTVKPSMPAGATNAALKIEPILLADDDGNELGDGWIVGVDINYWQMGSGACMLKKGQAFFEAEINRGPSNMHQGITLIKQAIEPSGHVSWPNGNISAGKAEGIGFIRLIPIANPSAATEWSITVPPKARWKLRAIRYTFTAGSTTGRTPGLVIDDGGSNVIFSGAPSANTDTVTTAIIQIYPNSQYYSRLNAAGTAYQNFYATPDIILPAGYRIRSSTTGITGTDQHSGIFLEVEEWLEE